MTNIITIYIIIQKQCLYLDSTQIKLKATDCVIINRIYQVLSCGCAAYNKTTLTVCNIVNKNKAIQTKYDFSIRYQNKTWAFVVHRPSKTMFNINHNNAIIDVCLTSRRLSIGSCSFGTFSGFVWFLVQQYFRIKIFNFVDYLLVFWIDCKRIRKKNDFLQFQNF